MNKLKHLTNFNFFTKKEGKVINKDVLYNFISSPDKIWIYGFDTIEALKKELHKGHGPIIYTGKSDGITFEEVKKLLAKIKSKIEDFKTNNFEKCLDNMRNPEFIFIAIHS